MVVHEQSPSQAVGNTPLEGEEDIITYYGCTTCSHWHRMAVAKAMEGEGVQAYHVEFKKVVWAAL